MDLLQLLNPEAVEPQGTPTDLADPDNPEDNFPMQKIPLLPPSPQFDSFDDLYDFLQTFHRDNGAALIKALSSRKRGQERPTNYVFVCDRGQQRASTSHGLPRVAHPED